MQHEYKNEDVAVDVSLFVNILGGCGGSLVSCAHCLLATRQHNAEKKEKLEQVHIVVLHTRCWKCFALY